MSDMMPNGDPDNLTHMKISVQILEQKIEFQENLVNVLSLFEKQGRLDHLTYLKLYHTKQHVYSLLPSTDENITEELHSTDESSDAFTENSETEENLCWPSSGGRQVFPVLKSVYQHKSGMQHIEQTMKKSTPGSESIDTKKPLQDAGFGIVEDSSLRHKLLTKKSESEDEEVRKNPTDLLEWKPKADSMVQELSPITLNEYITSIIGEGVVLATDDRSLDFKTSRAIGPPVTSSSSQVHLLREFQHGRLHKRQFRDLLGKAIIEDSSSLSDLEAKTGRLQRVFGPVYIFRQTHSTRSFPVSCPAMTLSRERVYKDLAVAGEAGQFLTNTERSRGTEHRPDQFEDYRGTCSAPLPLPDSPFTRTVPRYWETNSRLQWKERDPGQYLLEMAVTEEEDPNRTTWVSGLGSGWGVGVRDCKEHAGSYCIDVCENGRQVGECFSTIPSPTHDKDVEIRLGIVLDVGRGRLAFIDVNREKVLHKFDVTFCQPPYPLFGVWPDPDYAINMQLVSGGDISITDSKKRLILEALFSS